MNATRSGRAAWAIPPERIGERRVAAALDDEPDAALEQGRRGAASSEVEALLRIEPADHAR